MLDRSDGVVCLENFDLFTVMGFLIAVVEAAVRNRMLPRGRANLDK